MKIVVAGNDFSFEECKSKLGITHEYHRVKTIDTNFEADVIFDFNADRREARLKTYANIGAPLFINTVNTTLQKLNTEVQLPDSVFGFCGWPGFFNRSVIEVSLLNEASRPVLDELSKQLNLPIIVVPDQVGMITPRIISMIINEAHEALQQGVASREDIDLSMKLGTNYPFGSFEWAEKIGLDKVKKLLTELERATGDSRYRLNF